MGPIIDAFLNIFRKNQVRIDVSEFLSLKVKSAKELKSEIEIISSKQKAPLEQNNKFPHRFLKNKELFYVDK
jgi:hypothetical protein